MAERQLSIRRRTDAVAEPTAAAAVDVQIVGPPFSGSTLLGNALNAHPAIAHVGEVSDLPTFDVGPTDDACNLCLGRGEQCPVWTAETVARIAAAGAPNAADVLREVTGAPVIVDSSKWVPWLHAVDVPGRLRTRRVQALLTLRHPFAFVDSVRRRDGVEPWQGANLWRDTIFDALRSLAKLSVPTMLVRYEDFALDPQPTLERICRSLGLDFDPGMLTFWETPAHAIGGNSSAFVWYPGYVHSGHREGIGLWSEVDAELGDRYRERGFGGWVDDKWRATQDVETRRQIMGTPLLSDLATLVGYDLLAEN